MLDTLQTLLIALFVLVPGFVGDRAYRELIGPGKSEGMREVLVWLVFSLVSGALYSATAYLTQHTTWVVDLPPLEYAELARLATDGRGIIIPNHWFLTLAVHTTVAILLGVLLGLVGRRWNAFGLGYRFQTTWDHLITKISPGRHVLVERTNGSLIVGVLQITMRMKDPADRDIVLQDPRAFSIKEGLSEPDDHAYLYLPAEEVRSLAFIVNTDDLNRRGIDVRQEQQQQQPREAIREWFQRRWRRPIE